MSEDRRRRLLALNAAQRAQFESAVRNQQPLSDRADAVAVDASDTGSFVQGRGADERPPSFSLFFFSDEGGPAGPGQYDFLLEAARFADAHGFEAIWIPERHFHSFGQLYPSPAVLAAAIAVATRRIDVRAGSVVLPLHQPIRVAEEWSVVDNLSGGRVGVSFASGWVPEDFVLARTTFARRRETTLADLEVVRRLWRGEAIEVALPGGGSTSVQVFPRPLQPELPVWLTTSGSRRTWLEAGRLGTHVLTGLLQGNLDELAAHAFAYREARRAAGHDPSEGQITLMLHTFIGLDAATVRDCVRAPLVRYLRAHLGLYETQRLAANELGIDGSRLSEDDKTAIAEFAFDRYFEHNGLFGTPESAVEMVQRIRASGVNEIGCLVDFGVDRDTLSAHLCYLAELRDRVHRKLAVAGHG